MTLTFIVDLSVAVDVGLLNHLVDFLVRQLLAEVRHHVTQFRRGNEAVAVLIEHCNKRENAATTRLDRMREVTSRTSESFADLVFTVLLLHLSSHHREELREVDGSVSCKETEADDECDW